MSDDGGPFEHMSWRVRRTLRDGKEVVLRPIEPTDRDELLRAFRTLSPETRYRRFFSAVTEPSEATLRYLTEVDQKDHVAIVASLESLDLKSERGVGVARFVRVPGEPDVAEAAVTVVDDMQRNGLGTLLLAELARAAWCRGIRKFRGEVLGTNEPMRQILESVGATLVREVPDDPPSGAELLEEELAKKAGSDPDVTYRFEVALQGEDSEPTIRALVRAAALSMAEAVRSFIGLEQAPD